jgi:hypothetical protein
MVVVVVVVEHEINLMTSEMNLKMDLISIIISKNITILKKHRPSIVAWFLQYFYTAFDTSRFLMFLGPAKGRPKHQKYGTASRQGAPAPPWGCKHFRSALGPSVRLFIN